MKNSLLLLPILGLGAVVGCPAPMDPPIGGTGGAPSTGSGGASTNSGGAIGNSGGAIGSGGGTPGASGGASGSTGGSTGSGGSTSGSGGAGPSTGGSTTGSGGSTTGSGGGAVTGGRGVTTGGATGSAGSTGAGGAVAGTGGAAPADASAVGALFQGQAWVVRCGPLNAGTQRVCGNTMTLNGNTNLSGTIHSDPVFGGLNRNDFVPMAPGTAGADYCVTIRVQGIAEGKQYVNDTVTNRSGTPYGVTGTINFGNSTDASADGNNGWAVGGMPGPTGDYNVYGFLVDSPRQVFYLNSINTSGRNRETHTSYAFSYMASFNIKGGSRVQFFASDANRNTIRNCAEPEVEAQCNPLPNISPIPMPLQGPTGMPVTITQPVNGQLVVTTLVSARAGTCTCPNPATCT